SLVCFLLLALRRPPGFSFFPYTTLFRSAVVERLRVRVGDDELDAGEADLHHAVHGIAAAAADADHLDLRAAPRGGVERQPELLRSEEHTSELQSLRHLVCRLLLDKKKNA